MENNNKPKIGDTKRKVRFAILPVKVEGKWLWWEKYIKVYVYKTKLGMQEMVASSGLLEDALTTTGLLNERRFTKYYTFEDWELLNRELPH